MNQRQGCDDRLVGQVAVERIQLVGPKQALVDDSLARQTGDVEVVAVFLGEARVHGVFDNLANDVELALELILVRRQFATADEELPDHRRNLRRQFAGLGEVHRHVAPAQEHLVFLPDGLLDRPLAPAPVFGAPGQEHHADGVLTLVGQGYAGVPALPFEEGMGKLEQQARPVARMGIASACASMLKIDQYPDGIANDVVRFMTVEIRYDTYAAGIMLIGRIVQALGLFHKNGPLVAPFRLRKMNTGTLFPDSHIKPEYWNTVDLQ